MSLRVGILAGTVPPPKDRNKKFKPAEMGRGYGDAQPDQDDVFLGAVLSSYSCRNQANDYAVLSASQDDNARLGGKERCRGCAPLGGIRKFPVEVPWFRMIARGLGRQYNKTYFPHKLTPDFEKFAFLRSLPNTITADIGHQELRSSSLESYEVHHYHSKENGP